MVKRFICRYIIILFFSLPYLTYSQANEWLNTDYEGSMCLGIEEVGDTIFAIISNGPVNEIDSNIEYKLSINTVTFLESEEPDFTLIERFTFFSDEQYSTLGCHFIEDTNEWMFVQSYTKSPGKQSFRFLLCDDIFNIINARYVDVLGHLNPAFYIDSYQGHTYVLGIILGPPGDQLLFLNYEHSNLGYLHSIKVGQTVPITSGWVTSMRIDPITNDMLVFFHNGIQIIDTTLFQKQRYDFFDINTAIHGDVLSLRSNYYSHGASRWNMEYSGFKIMLVQKYDTMFNILKSDTLGYMSHDNYPFVFNSIDERNDELLVGGHLAGPYSHFPLFSSIKKFYLAKYDEDLNRIWYREYGGDRGYWMTGLKLLGDGSCFAYGFVTDTLDDHRNAYILHVAANGDIISSTEFDNEQSHNISLINDGGNGIKISNPEQIIAQLYLFDLNGRSLLNTAINQKSEYIDVDYLPPAIYPYSIIKDGRVISSGKWVKLE